MWAALSLSSIIEIPAAKTGKALCMNQVPALARDSVWRCRTQGPIISGSNSIGFAQLSVVRSEAVPASERSII
jgi:hypothetical protein